MQPTAQQRTQVMGTEFRLQGKKDRGNRGEAEAPTCLAAETGQSRSKEDERHHNKIEQTKAKKEKKENKRKITRVNRMESN